MQDEASENVSSVIRQVWNELDNEELRKDNSHWRGIGRWRDDTKWRSIGANTVQLLSECAYFVRKPPFTSKLRVLEWGPGGGSNALAMNRFAERYYGVDISAKNLAECRRMLAEEGIQDYFQPVLIESSLTAVDKSVDAPIDVFVSTAVFQHFPSKDYGVEVLKTVKRISSSDFMGVVQIRYDNGNEKFAPIQDISEYEEKHITATSYQIDEFWTILRKVGFSPRYLKVSNSDVNYATFLFT